MALIDWTPLALTKTSQETFQQETLDKIQNSVLAFNTISQLNKASSEAIVGFNYVNVNLLPTFTRTRPCTPKTATTRGPSSWAGPASWRSRSSTMMVCSSPWESDIWSNLVFRSWEFSIRETWPSCERELRRGRPLCHQVKVFSTNVCVRIFTFFNFLFL